VLTEIKPRTNGQIAITCLVMPKSTLKYWVSWPSMNFANRDHTVCAMVNDLRVCERLVLPLWALNRSNHPAIPRRRGAMAHTQGGHRDGVYAEHAQVNDVERVLPPESCRYSGAQAIPRAEDTRDPCASGALWRCEG
jgi:hypothetical protein